LKVPTRSFGQISFFAVAFGSQGSYMVFTSSPKAKMNECA
jgi:hypothetical protein